MNEEKIKEIFLHTQSAEHKIDRGDGLVFFLKKLLTNHYKREEFLFNFIFLSEEEITNMNKSYLGHDYATDVITFDFSEDFGVFGGDIFICPQLIAENAESYGVDYQIEMLRVICHGMLHLLGFDDKNDKQKEEIRTEEDLCIAAYMKQENL